MCQVLCWVLYVYSVSLNPPASPVRQVWLLSLIQFRKWPKTQPAKLQNQDSDLVWLNLYQMHLFFLRPSQAICTSLFSSSPLGVGLCGSLPLLCPQRPVGVTSAEVAVLWALDDLSTRRDRTGALAHRALGLSPRY